MENIFGHYAQEYDRWYENNMNAYLSEISVLKKVMLPGRESLEIGVGTGRFAALLGISTGLDPSLRMLKMAKRRGIDVLLGGGENLPFRDSIFSNVLIINTLCFVKDPEKVIKESKRVMRRGGKIVIGMIERNSFLGRYYQEKKSRFYNKLNFFSVEEGVSLLKKINYDNFSFFQTIFHLPSKMHSIEKAIEGYGEGGFVVICAQSA